MRVISISIPNELLLRIRKRNAEATIATGLYASVSAFICSAVEDKLKMFDVLPDPTQNYAKTPPPPTPKLPRKKRSKRGAK